MTDYIRVLTTSSSIVDIAGNPATGRLIVSANAPFEWDAPGGRAKVTMLPLVIPVVNGKLNATPSLAPTHNAGHDTDNISYKAYFDIAPRQWFEIWTLDALGSSSIEITDMVIQQSSIAPNTVISTAQGQGLIAGGLAGQMLQKASASDYDMQWAANALDRANHSGMQPITSINGLGAAAAMNVGPGANLVATGDHNHTGIYEPADNNIQQHLIDTNNPHHVDVATLPSFSSAQLNGGYF